MKSSRTLSTANACSALCAFLLLSLLFLCNCTHEKEETAQGRTLAEHANALFDAGRYVEAFDTYTHALKRAEKEKDYHTYAMCLSNLGSLFASFNDYDQALIYFTEAYADAMEHNCKDIASTSVINMVTCLALTGDVQKAKDAFLLQQRTPLADKGLVQYFSLHSQAYIAIAEKNYPLALSLLRSMLKLADERDLGPFYTDDVRIEIGRCQLALNRPDSAILTLKDNVEVCLNHQQSLYLADTYKLMAEVYKKMNDQENYHQTLSNYTNLSDSIFGTQRFNSAKGKLTTYENQRSKALLDSITRRYNYTRIILLFTVVLFLVAAVAYFIIQRQKVRLKQAYSSLYDKHKELERMRTEQLAAEQQIIESKCFPSGPQVDDENTTGNIAKLLPAIQEALSRQENIVNPAFSLDDLASIIGANSKYVSQAINSGYGKNFKSVLNEIRIAEACRRLEDVEGYGKLTIKAIAESVGYNSINNFIIAFKKIVGMTPSVYQKEARQRLGA